MQSERKFVYANGTAMKDEQKFTCDLEELAAGLPRVSRLLGFDVGSKRIGIAVSDPGRLVATPLQVVKRGDWRSVLQSLQGILKEEQPGGIIVGYPLHLSGGEGAACQAVRAFCRNLHGGLVADGNAVPIALWDERLSTLAGERMLKEEADLSRAKRRSVIDAVAAGIILQSALDYLRNKLE